MRSTPYLLLAAAGLATLTLAPDLRGQAPATSTAPIMLPVPGATPRAYTVMAAPGGRNQRDIEADQQTAALLKNLKEAKDEAAKTELQKKLTETLAKQFDVRQKHREGELKDLEDRVKRLREVLDKRQKAKETIVRSRLDQLLREAEGLGWGDSTHEVQGHAVPRFSTPSNVPAR